MELEETASGTIRLDQERYVLELVWSANDLGEDDVKRMLERFGEHAQAHRGSNLLVDVRRFRFAWGPAMDAWRDERVIPVYNEARVRKFAFLLPAGAQGPPTAKHGPALFETAYFDSREAAEAWFSTD